MDIVLPDLCDTHGDRVTVLAPLFRTFGARRAFGGPISTIKCFEDNSLVAEAVEEPGAGRVLVVDGGASDLARFWAIISLERLRLMAGPVS